MVNKTVISESLDVKDRVGNAIVFPQNKVLYADQFSSEAPESAFEKTMFSPSSMDDVFETFKPKKNVGLEADNGDIVYEDIAFHNMDDFDDDNIIANSKTLSECEMKADSLSYIIRALERNRTLIQIINNKEARKALYDTFESFVQDLSKNI